MRVSDDDTRYRMRPRERTAVAIRTPAPASDAPPDGFPTGSDPEIAVIPSALLHEGANEVTVRLLVWGPLTGFLDRIYVGPDDALRPAYERRVLLFVTLPVVLAAWPVNGSKARAARIRAAGAMPSSLPCAAIAPAMAVP